MIQENCIEFTTVNLYNLYKDEVDPTSFVFISEPGKEKLIAHGVEYNLVPSGGEPGQVLKWGIGGFGWSLEKNINVSGNKTVQSIDPSLDFLVAKNTSSIASEFDTTNTISLSGNMVAGHEMTIIAKNINEKNMNWIINIPNDDIFINLNPSISSVTIPPGGYAHFYLIGDGSNVYIKIIQ